MRSAPITLLLSAFLCTVGCSDSGDGDGGETASVGATGGTGGGATSGAGGATTSGAGGGATTGAGGGATTGTGDTTTGTGGATTGTGDTTTGAGGGTGGSDGTGGSAGGGSARVPAGSASTLREAGEKANPPILIGAAISGGGLNDNNYKRVAAAEHSYVTAENEMKWESVEPQAGQFSWGAGDNIVNWARQNNMKVKGHTLVWHNQLPGWMSSMTGKDNVTAAMRRHITQVMGHFKDRIDSWDVVNEAVQTDSDTGVGNPRMRPSVFLNQIGEGYIDLAFQIAREQDPKAKLYYNDYSIDARNAKVDFVYNMVKGMVERGVPIDGVGFQMHIGPPNNEAGGADVAANLKRFTDLGLEVLISEMDINRCGGVVTAEEQLAYYHDIVEACFKLPKCTAVTFWGINDGRSWLNSWSGALCNGQQSSQSLLFNDQYQKKETYNRVMDALLGK
ncbi:endo-1,4-beta-xylanase [Sorangium sp. So ce1000]|uniref:endo-1,4-beta-xylanase n=1 Tax=Sorangium sp. So ce1000 TaxID=3133325 RepID=UPI003F5DEFB5